MLELLKTKGTFASDKAFYGFMWGVAGNVYKNWCKKHAKPGAMPLDEKFPDSGVPFTEMLEKESEISNLHRQLILLGEQHRKVTVMYYFDGMKVSAISNALNISQSMVKFLLFKSRKILKEGINMERTFGDSSFNPRRMALGISTPKGGSWPGCVDPTNFERNVIAQNIVLTCYNEGCTAEEISLQLGIAVPYLEKDLQELCEWSGVLKKTNNRYETDIVIFTREFAAEANAKTLEHQRKIADTITRFLDEKLNDFKQIGFYLGGCDDSLLRWRITHFILEQAVLKKFDKGFDFPTKHDGRSLFLWGIEDGKYGCLAIGYHNDTGGQLQFLRFFVDNWLESTTDWGYFWNREERVNLMLDIANGKQTGFSDNETIEIAELIRLGYLKKDGNEIKPCVPVYTAAQYEQAATLTSTVTAQISEITRQMLEISTDILVQHTPASKKKDAETIGWLRTRDIAMNRPVEIMMGSGALRRTTENERATCYVLQAQQ
jgi:RNA polymerase sigma factor (sigma-70 family)